MQRAYAYCCSHGIHPQTVAETELGAYVNAVYTLSRGHMVATQDVTLEMLVETLRSLDGGHGSVCPVNITRAVN